MMLQVSLSSSSSVSLLQGAVLATALTVSPAAASLLSHDAVRGYAANTSFQSATEVSLLPILDSQTINPRPSHDDVRFDDIVTVNDNTAFLKFDTSNLEAIGNYALGKMHITQQAHERISYLRSLENGWLGHGSAGASHNAWIEAVSLLERIGAVAPDQPLPTLGLASDGEIIFAWNKNGLIGNLSIFGDGTYSFFAKKNGNVVSVDDAKIIDPLHEKLVDILAS